MLILIHSEHTLLEGCLHCGQHCGSIDRQPSEMLTEQNGWGPPPPLLHFKKNPQLFFWAKLKVEGMAKRKRKRVAVAVEVEVEQKEKEMQQMSAGGGESYERLREERIKENLDKIQKLGIIRLKSHLYTNASNPNPNPNHQKKPTYQRPPAPSSTHMPLPPRRSSRLQNASPISYAEVACVKIKDDPATLVVEGQKEEVYTEQHAALLGSCEMIWTLFVDGYGSNGRRIYDQVKGKTCHQCRQKTLGHHTHCSRCNLVQGQFCGDCLYMRYGENVLEVEKNADWICPVCRGICNCSLCRTKKGWAPTGSLYRKVIGLGYKSVAHYLIQTRGRQTDASENQIPAQLTSSSLDPSLSIIDAQEEEEEEEEEEDSLGIVQNAINTDIAADVENNYDLQTKRISVYDKEEPSHRKDSFMAENNIGLNEDDLVEKGGGGGGGMNGCKHERDDEHHTASNINLPARTVVTRSKSNSNKEAAEKPIRPPDGIAGRLRKKRAPATFAGT